MKNNRLSQLSLLAVVGAFLACVPLRAQTNSPVERVVLTQEVMFMVQGGVSLPMTNEITLSHNITVMTNGTFRIKDAKPRPLTEGQVLAADGMLTSPDGTVVPVFDHVAFLKGQPTLMRDGERSPLRDDLDLSDGGRVTADGYLLTKSGVRRKLQDGEIIELTGKAVPTQDTISLQDGKVVVQKDGSSMALAPDRSVMMNDGTKVFGDGTVVSKDGSKKTLAPGEILKVEGVMPKTR